VDSWVQVRAAVFHDKESVVCIGGSTCRREHYSAGPDAEQHQSVDVLGAQQHCEIGPSERINATLRYNQIPLMWRNRWVD
jgi:hypothetical protein